MKREGPARLGLKFRLPDPARFQSVSLAWILSLLLFVLVAVVIQGSPIRWALSVGTVQWFISLPLLISLAFIPGISGQAAAFGALTLNSLAIAGAVVLAPSLQLSPPILFGLNLVSSVILLAASSWLRRNRSFTLSNGAESSSQKNVWLVVAASLFLWGTFQRFLEFVRPQRILTDLPIDLDWAISDMRLFEVLSNGIASYGLTESGIVSGSPLRYHLLPYAYLGGLNETHGLEPFSGQRYFIPAYVAVALTIGIVTWASRISGRVGAGFVAAVLVLVADSVASATFGGIGGSVIRDVSASTTVTALWFLAVSWLNVSLLRRGSWAAPIVGLFGSFVVTGGKVTTGAVLCGLSLGIATYALLRKKDVALSLANALAIGFGTVVAFYFFAYGQTGGGLLILSDWVSVVRSVVIDPTFAAGSLFVWFVTWFAFIPRWSGIVGLARPGFRFYMYGALGVLGVGSLFYVVFSPESVDRGWIMVGAAPILGVFAGVGIDLIWKDGKVGLSRVTLVVVSVAAYSLLLPIANTEIVQIRPIVFPTLIVLAAALATLAAYLVGKWRNDRVATRRAIIGAAALSLTLASLLAPLLAPLTSSPPPPRPLQELILNEWRSSEWLAEVDVPSSVSNTVIAVWSEQDLWAPALLKLRSFSSSEFVGLGNRELALVSERRRGQMDQWAQQESLNVQSMCDSGVGAVWTTDDSLWSESVASLEKAGGRLWWLDCAKTTTSSS